MRLVTIKRRFGYVSEIIKYYGLFPIAQLIYGRRNIYLFSERGHDARDNGYHMFKYYNEKHPELETYYVIDRQSPDLYKVNQIGNIVWHRSLKHYMLFIASKYKISTHIMGYSPNTLFYSKFYRWLPLTGKYIFLQHGVIKDDLPSLYREKVNIDMFVCGAKPEYDYVSSHFHYVNGEVKYTGLARYDGLQDYTTKRQILIMPTWRINLKYSPPEAVAKSKYVERWNSLLNNDDLSQLADQYDVDIVFYPHYEMQRYIDLFKSEKKRIMIADFAAYDVQVLLKESMLLITDFSSVYFDFAYMGKPCLYYQFDQEEFFKNHYAPGYFKYDTMGFGPVLMEESALVEELRKSAEADFRIEHKYSERIKGFFPLHDNKNCERIYEEIELL